jgi:hypothetical protein
MFPIFHRNRPKITHKTHKNEKMKKKSGPGQWQFHRRWQWQWHVSAKFDLFHPFSAVFKNENHEKRRKNTPKCLKNTPFAAFCY